MAWTQWRWDLNLAWAQFRDGTPIGTRHHEGLHLAGRGGGYSFSGGNPSHIWVGPHLVVAPHMGVRSETDVSNTWLLGHSPSSSFITQDHSPLPKLQLEYKKCTFTPSVLWIYSKYWDDIQIWYNHHKNGNLQCCGNPPKGVIIPRTKLVIAHKLLRTPNKYCDHSSIWWFQIYRCLDSPTFVGINPHVRKPPKMFCSPQECWDRPQTLF